MKVTFKLDEINLQETEGVLEAIAVLNQMAIDLMARFNKEQRRVFEFEIFRFEVETDPHHINDYFRIRTVVVPNSTIGTLRQPNLEIELPRYYVKPQNRRPDVSLADEMEGAILSFLRNHYENIRQSAKNHLVSLR